MEDQAEYRCQKLVNRLMQDVVVRRVGNTSFGLRRCECVHNAGADCKSCMRNETGRIAGWLGLGDYNVVNKTIKEASNLLGLEHDMWDRRYVVLNDAYERLELYKSESKSLLGLEEASLVISISKITRVDVHAFRSNRQIQYAFQVGYKDENRDKEVLIQLKPIEGADWELVARWVALLQHRAKLYHPALDSLAAVVKAGILRLQAVYRRRKVEKVIQQEQYHRKQLQSQDLGGSLAAFSSMVGRLFQHPPATTTANTESKSNKEKDVSRFREMDPTKGDTLSETTRWVREIAPNEEEDEVWENERWNFLSVKDKTVVRGWSHGALLPQERRAFSDRIGNFVAKSMQDIQNIPLPRGWKITTPFIVDTSGLAHAKCDAQGWRYESQFNALDSKQAKGGQRGKGSARWVVRHRRWYRRRAPIKDADELALEGVTKPDHRPSWMITRGWLGMRGLSTGVFWRSRYCVLGVPKGILEKGEESDETSPRPYDLKVGFWGYFCASFSDHGALHNMSHLDWSHFTEKELKIKYLDAECVVDDSMASPDFPGYFSLHLSGESKPRLLNADTKEDRIRWVAALRTIIANSKSAQSTMELLDRSVIHPRGRSLSNGSDFDEAHSQSTENTDTAQIISSNSFTNKSKTELIRLSRKGKDGMKKILSINNPGSTTTTRPKSDESSSFSIPETDGICSLEETTVFDMPEQYENLIIDQVFDVALDKMNEILFLDDKFYDSVYDGNGIANVKRSAWTDGCKPRSNRTLSYLIPKNTPVPENQAYLSLQYIQVCPGLGYQVDNIISTPDVPYGKSFNTAIRFCLVPGDNAGETTRVVISHQILFLQSTVMRGFIRAGGAQQVRKSFQHDWVGRLHKFIHDNNLLSHQTEAGDTKHASFKDNGAFRFPEMHENLVLDVEFAGVSVDQLKDVLYMDDIYQKEQFEVDCVTNIDMGSWSNESKSGSIRKMSYLLPRNGPVPKNTMYVTYTFAQSVPGKGYQIEQVGRNPEVPFGKTFETHLRIVLEAVDDTKTRVVISHRVEFLTSTMMARFIRNGSAKEVANVFSKKWLPSVKAFLEKKFDLAVNADQKTQSINEPAAPSPQIRPETVPQPVAQRRDEMKGLHSARLAVILLAIVTILVLVLIYQMNAITKQQQLILAILLEKAM